MPSLVLQCIDKEKNHAYKLRPTSPRIARHSRTHLSGLSRCRRDGQKLPPHGFTGKVHQIDPKMGGTYKMSFTNFSTGHSHSFGGEFLELVPHERIRHTDKFDVPNLSGEMQTTVVLKNVFCGTVLNIVQEGIPEAIPPEACYLGWQESLTLLAQLVEAEIHRIAVVPLNPPSTRTTSAAPCPRAAFDCR
jgi:uncharacterized protein YndB with AHSA1/START domain